ncbi:hypothetical protein E4T56_gene18154 [Termitomyces sp. T112]|nr:hypothetical protein C0989_009931 [Termitomyces sp. Mn162]KAG5723607.1 hypothetical protein E4T56_gene18154 [Termitomyces sp. T112]
MSSSSTNPSDFVKHSDPITINTSTRRGRSVSVSSGSTNSEDSPPDLRTPMSASASQRSSFPSSGTSPILSYFLAQSPTKSPANSTFPFSRKFGPPPVFEEDEGPEVPVAAHARRTNTAVADRFSQPQPNPVPDPQLERGTGLLRRLSLSNGAFVKPPAHHESRSPPSPPPNSAVSPISKSIPFVQNSRPRRSATMNEGAKPRRAPSPMGERILKGHFDGFN